MGNLSIDFSDKNRIIKTIDGEVFEEELGEEFEYSIEFLTICQKVIATGRKIQDMGKEFK